MAKIIDFNIINKKIYSINLINIKKPIFLKIIKSCVSIIFKMFL